MNMSVVNKVVEELLIDCYNETEDVYSKCPSRCCDNKCKFFAEVVEENEDQLFTPENITTLKEILINKNKSIALMNIKSDNTRIKKAAYKLLFHEECIETKLQDMAWHITYDSEDYVNKLISTRDILTLSMYEVERIMFYDNIKREDAASKDFSINWHIPCPHYKTIKCHWQEGDFCCISDSPGTAQKESEMFREILIEKHKDTALFCLDHKPYNVDMAAKYILGLPYCELPNKPLTSNLP
jgi:hypothetical protein